MVVADVKGASKPSTTADFAIWAGKTNLARSTSFQSSFYTEKDIVDTYLE